MKRNFIISFITIVNLLIVISLMQGCGKNGSNVIKIGANLPLTGDFALYGQNDKKGIDLALSQIDPKYNIKVIYQDNQGTAKNAVLAANNLLNDNIKAVIDDAISGITLATIPIYTKAKVPMISTGATNPTLSGISPFFFRVWNSDAEEGVFAANAAIDTLKKSSAIILYINSDYGQGLKNVFEKKFQSLGGKIIDEISFEENIMDYRTIIAKFKNKNFDFIYLIGYAPQTGPFVKNLREQKVNATIFSTVATEDDNFLKLAGQYANGVIYVYNTKASGENYNNFVNSYRKKYNQDPQLLTDVGYDAMMIIYNAIKNGAKTGEEIKQYLADMKTYNGASGIIKFDKNGDVHKPMILKTIRNNKFINY